MRESSVGRGDGYGSVTMSVPLIKAIYRKKEEQNRGSRRAAIEYVFGSEHSKQLFREPDGRMWTELKNAMEASIEVDPDPETDGVDVQILSVVENVGGPDLPPADVETGDALSW